MVISVILLAVLFIVGFSNIFFHFPTNKFYAWIQSFFIKTRPSAIVGTASSSNLQIVSSSSSKERSEYKKAELKRVFGTFDKDGDEFITQKELRESFKNLRLSVTEKEVEEMVVKVDANGDGLIDFDEFCILYEAMVGENYPHDGIFEEGGDGEGDLKEAFDVFDKDHDGLISVEELGFVLSSLGLNEGKKVENCKEMIRKVDMDGDGMVNFDEFKRMMKTRGGLEVETNQKEISIHGL